MKKSLLQLLLFAQILMRFLFVKMLYSRQFSFSKVKLSFLFSFVYFSLWAQPPYTYSTTTDVIVPAGVGSMTVQAWGAGGAGGGCAIPGSNNLYAAAGGGGGAFASNSITVTPGSTIRAIVGAATAGSTGNGANGGHSTIQGFEATIYAAGGLGGGGNISGGTPAFGAGGSLANSKGQTTTAGGNGGDGRSATIGLLFSSGGGGSGAGTGGGFGGVGVLALIGGVNSPGNNGSEIGGGGGGAMAAGSGGPEIGGAGARGQITLNYTCPAYTFTSFSGASACISPGTSLITVTSTATALPAGNYTVTYSRSAPVAATGLTASMTVNSSGVGTFTAVGLTVASSTTITITRIESGGCFRNFTSGNTTTVAVNDLPQGTLTASGPSCGTGAGQLTFTASAGTGNYTVVYKENGGADRTATGVVSGTAFTPFTTPVLTTTNYTLVSVTGANTCARTSSFTGGTATITVNPQPQGSLTANGPFCTSGAPQLIFTATSGLGPYTVIYKENGGADRSVTGVISGTAFTPFTTPVLNTTIYTLVSVTGSNSCIRNTGFTGGSATVTINTVPAAPTISNIIQPNCTTATGSIVVNGLSGSGNLLQSDGTNIVNRPYSGTSLTISGLAIGKYKFAIDNSCGLNYSTDVNIQANTWNGTTWSYGLDPTADNLVDFRGDYNISADVNACSCTITNAAAVTIQNGRTLNVVKGVHVVSGSLTFADGANLLQTSTDNNLNTGNITYKRASKPIRQADYVYWSTPVKGQTLAGVSPLTASDKYLSYDGTKWVAHPNTDVMIVGKGYIIRGPENYSNTVRSPFAVAFVGVPNNGDINGETVLNSKYYLIGNPYPSALNADDFILANTLLEGTLHFWTHNTPVVLGPNYKYASDDYATYNLSGGVRTQIAAPSGNNPADPDANKNVPSGEIAAGQSFFAGTKASGTIQFKNYMRRGGALNGQFYKPGNAAKNVVLEKHRLWLNMTNAEGAFKQTLIGYIEGATNDYDPRYDGTSLDGNPYLDFYSVNSGVNLVIQGRALPLKNTDTVPLGYRTTIEGQFTIAIDQADGNMNYQSVYLEDKNTGTIHDLRASNYTFTTTAGTFADRLVLRYTNKTLGTDDFENSENYVLIAAKDRILKLTASKENIQQVTVFDASGKAVFTKNKINATELQITDLQVRHQVLLVKVILENGKTVTKKIVF